MEEFFPFGSAVHFLRSNTIKKDDRPPKFAPTGASGVILGYRLHPGCKWRHEYIVAELDAFVDVDFRFDANPKQTPKVRTQIVQEVRKPEGETTFALRARYLRFNATIEGAITAAGKDVQDELAGNPLVEPLRVGDDTIVEEVTSLLTSSGALSWKRPDNPARIPRLLLKVSSLAMLRGVARQGPLPRTNRPSCKLPKVLSLAMPRGVILLGQSRYASHPVWMIHHPGG